MRGADLSVANNMAIVETYCCVLKSTWFLKLFKIMTFQMHQCNVVHIYWTFVINSIELFIACVWMGYIMHVILKNLPLEIQTWNFWQLFKTSKSHDQWCHRIYPVQLLYMYCTAVMYRIYVQPNNKILTICLILKLAPWCKVCYTL